MKSLLGDILISPHLKGKIKAKEDCGDIKMRKGKRKGDSVNKKLGGEMETDENKK